MRLLAVDDDPIILEILQGILGQGQGHELEVMTDPERALQRLSASHPFECLLLDIDMPRMNGVDLCRALRRTDGGRDLPVMMLTALDDKGTIDRAFAAGANDYLNKPIAAGELLARLANVARLARLNTLMEPGGADVARPGCGAVNHAVHEPFAIPMVNFTIAAEALENYVAKLSKQDLFGSAVFGFSVIGIEDIHATLSGFDFEALMTDVAEAISDCLHPNQFLMSYVGNGTFLCVTERGWVPRPQDFAIAAERMLQVMDLHDSHGQPIGVNLACSDLLRLTWKSGARAVDTLALAHEQSQAAAARIWRERTDPSAWYASVMKSA